MKSYLKYMILVALFSSMSVMAEQSESIAIQNEQGTAEPVSVPKTRVEQIATKRVFVPLSSLDWVDESGGVALTGATSRRSAYFAVRRDELITEAAIELYFTPSPALIPIRSQLNVYLNGYLQQTLPIEKEELGNRICKEVKLDPRAFKESNIFEFELIGHYTDICENPVDSCIWLNVSAQSRLRIAKQQLVIANDLSFFPLPFFNTSTNETSLLSVVFAKTPDDECLKAASIFASFGGVVTKWRGVDYPVFIDALPPTGHAVIFMTNDERPYFLKDHPKVQEPTVEMMDVPGRSADKLLVISAPDAEGLVQAVKALAAGNILFTGSISRVLDYQEIEKRRPYDAPNWVDTTKRFTLGSLAKLDGQLSSQGFQPAPINIDLNLPPDLYFVDGSRVNMNLIYKYTKPMKYGLSQLRFIINDHLIRSYPLDPDHEKDVISANLPLAGNLNLFGRSKVETSYLKPQNVLTFDFRYAMAFQSKVDECITTLPIPNRVEIDPNSTLDFTGIYHFTKMPNLTLFWQSGYPFSIYADLQETTAVVSDPSEVANLSALFNMLGRIGSQLGHAATNITLCSGNADANSLKDHDVLVVGQIPDCLRVGDNVNVVLSKTKQAISTSFNDTSAYRQSADISNPVVQHVEASGFEGVSALVSFRSPLNSDKTVVAMLADSPHGIADLSAQSVVSQTKILPAGSISVLKDAQNRSYSVGESYFSGNLPWYQRIYYLLLERPWILMLFTLFSCAVFCVLAYRFLRYLKQQRLARSNKRNAQ